MTRIDEPQADENEWNENGREKEMSTDLRCLGLVHVNDPCGDVTLRVELSDTSHAGHVRIWQSSKS